MIRKRLFVLGLYLCLFALPLGVIGVLDKEPPNPEFQG